jgi:catechol 2,3-dioxygenase-like lactoylglutathione lyase family enzyme
MEAKQLHRGRLIDHVHLIAHDLAASKRFYAAALGALGRHIEGEGEHYFWSDELFVSTADEHTRGATRVHLAFQARDDYLNDPRPSFCTYRPRTRREFLALRQWLGDMP